jgi:hypothetical protein
MSRTEVRIELLLLTIHKIESEDMVLTDKHEIMLHIMYAFVFALNAEKRSLLDYLAVVKPLGSE